MIRVLTYSSGRPKEVNFSKIKIDKNISWIYCSGIKLKDLKEISEKTKIPLFELRHALDPRETPRVFNRKSYSLIIFSAVGDAEDGKVTFPVEFIVTKKFMVTLVSENSKTLDGLFEELDGSFWKEVSKRGFGYMIYRILIDILRDYDGYLEDVDDKLDILEDRSIHGKEEDMHRLFKLKKKLIFVRNSLHENKKVLSLLSEKEWPFLLPEQGVYELQTELTQVLGTEDSIKERITTITEIIVSSISNKLNIIMKNFTVIASILLLPTLIAGIYGMNVILPLGENPGAFVIVLGIMIVSVTIMLLYFRSKDFL